MAQANGISISKGVFEYVSTQDKISFADLGIQKLKAMNHVYDVILELNKRENLKTNPFAKAEYVWTIAAS